MSNLRRVLVEWEDSWDESEHFYLNEEVAGLPEFLLEDIGFVVQDDERGIALAKERCLSDGDERKRRITFIPRGMIRKITELTELTGLVEVPVQFPPGPIY